MKTQFSLMEETDESELKLLFDYFLRESGLSSSTDKYNSQLVWIQAKCMCLFEKDFNLSVIANSNGEFCASYPLSLLILESDKNSKNNTKINTSKDLKPLLQNARFARARARHIMPYTIRYKGKNICRSSTLSNQAELIAQKAINNTEAYEIFSNSLSYFSHPTNQQSLQKSSKSAENLRNNNNSANSNSNNDNGILKRSGSANASYCNDSESMIDKVRGSDVELISKLGIKYICDLMVEDRKNKFGLDVCSSEKVDSKGRYNKFEIAAIPYPGCEFFNEFKKHSHCGEGLYFDWNGQTCTIPKLKSNRQLPVTLCDYKSWDLISITQNYLKVMLHYILDTSKDSGLLVHCISGWDRTPLFISLLRLSLWADGEIHQSLNAKQMLYLTVGYDWLLFGHQLKQRMGKGEDIFYFCFYFLEFITSAEFSVHNMQSDSKCESSKRVNTSFAHSSTNHTPLPASVSLIESNGKDEKQKAKRKKKKSKPKMEPEYQVTQASSNIIPATCSKQKLVGIEIDFLADYNPDAKSNEHEQSQTNAIAIQKNGATSSNNDECSTSPNLSSFEDTLPLFGSFTEFKNSYSHSATSSKKSSIFTSNSNSNNTDNNTITIGQATTATKDSSNFSVAEKLELRKQRLKEINFHFCLLYGKCSSNGSNNSSWWSGIF